METLNAASPSEPLDARKAFRVLLFYLFLQLVMGGLVGVVAGIVYLLLGGDASDPEVRRELVERATGPIGLAAALGAGLGVFYWTLLRPASWLRVEVRHEVGFGLGRPSRVAAALVTGLVLGAAYLFLAGWFAPPPADHVPGPVTRMATQEGWSRHAWMAAALLWAPFVEEYVFRGVFYGGLARTWGMAVAGFLTTLFFVLPHTAEIAGYWPAAIGITALSLGTLALRIRTRSLGPCVAFHFGYNLAMVILAYAAG